MGVTGPQNKLSGILSEIQKELETSRPKQQKKSYKCGMCGVKGHNRTTCPQKQAN